VSLNRHAAVVAITLVALTCVGEAGSAGAAKRCPSAQVALVLSPTGRSLSSSGPGRQLCTRAPKVPVTASGALAYEDQLLAKGESIKADRRFARLGRSAPLRRLLRALLAYANDAILKGGFESHAIRAPALAAGKGRTTETTHRTVEGPDGMSVDATTSTVTPGDDETGGGAGGKFTGSNRRIGAAVDKQKQLFVKQCPDGDGNVPGDFSGHEMETKSVEVHGTHLVQETLFTWEGKLDGHVAADGRIKDFEYHATGAYEFRATITNGAGKLMGRMPTRFFGSAPTVSTSTRTTHRARSGTIPTTASTVAGRGDCCSSTPTCWSARVGWWRNRF
jgi:hypothetical protein